MERRGEEREERLGNAPRSGWRTRSDRELIVAMRAGTSAAFEEFVSRYQPMLTTRSRRFALAQWEREDLVADVLESMMLRLIRPDVRAPKEMAAYLTRMLHNRLIDAARSRAGHAADEKQSIEWAQASSGGVLGILVSQHAAESCAPEYGDREPRLSVALERLATALVDSLSDDEQLLIGWESNMIPHRTIAAWIGVSHAAATKRIWRLRTRLRGLAARYMASLAPTEREEVRRVIGEGMDRQAVPTAAAEQPGTPYQAGDNSTGRRTKGYPAMEEQNGE